VKNASVGWHVAIWNTIVSGCHQNPGAEAANAAGCHPEVRTPKTRQIPNVVSFTDDHAEEGGKTANRGKNFLQPE
jgi:hypothetical protein